MFIAKNIKSEESFIHKESNQSTKYKKDSIFSEGTVPPIISNTQNTTCTSSISSNENTSSYIEYMKSLGGINHITDVNINNININDDKNNELKKKKENFELINNFLGTKRNIRFKSTKKFDESNLFKTYMFNHSKARFKIFQTNKDKLNSSKINKTNGINEGRWSFDEHIKFIEGIILFKNNWVKVAKYVGTRGPIQARSHSQKFYFKLKKAKNNEFHINFQNRNIKNIFDIIYLLKERNNSNNNEKEYIINALTSLTKITNFLIYTNNNKVNDRHNDIIKVNQKNIINNNMTIKDNAIKTETKKNIFFINKINDKLNDDNDKEKEEKISIDNHDIFKDFINIDINSNSIDDENEDKLQYDYINKPENKSYISDDDAIYIKDELNLSDIINLNFKKNKNTFIKNQTLPNLKFLSYYFS